MNREQQLNLIEHVQVARALASDPISHGGRERPFRLTGEELAQQGQSTFSLPTRLEM